MLLSRSGPLHSILVTDLAAKAVHSGSPWDWGARGDPQLLPRLFAGLLLREAEAAAENGGRSAAG